MRVVILVLGLIGFLTSETYLTPRSAFVVNDAYQKIKQDTLNTIFTNLSNKSHALKVCQKNFDVSIYQPTEFMVASIINQIVTIQYSLLAPTNNLDPITTAVSVSVVMKRYAKAIKPSINDWLGSLKDCHVKMDNIKQLSAKIIKDEINVTLDAKRL
ncbi:hypothetical protein [Helicobacter cetorum]|uniref:hypothetical protein n=1 Tax=Helicobacter cetorum TaxID=138563 RepID=UPI000CF0B7A2|nr:hypothetical protein [Helicobacter cetorum]